jgi:hypothetical protein
MAASVQDLVTANAQLSWPPPFSSYWPLTLSDVEIRVGDLVVVVKPLLQSKSWSVELDDDVSTEMIQDGPAHDFAATLCRRG